MAVRNGINFKPDVKTIIVTAIITLAILLIPLSFLYNQPDGFLSQSGIEENITKEPPVEKRIIKVYENGQLIYTLEGHYAAVERIEGGYEVIHFIEGQQEDVQISRFFGDINVIDVPMTEGA